MLYFPNQAQLIISQSIFRTTHILRCLVPRQDKRFRLKENLKLKT